MVRMRDRNREREKGGRRWLTQADIIKKYQVGGRSYEEARQISQEIIDGKENCPHMKVNHIRPHPNLPTRHDMRLFLIWDESYETSERDIVVEQLFEGQDDGEESKKKKKSSGSGKKNKKRKNMSSSSSDDDSDRDSDDSDSSESSSSSEGRKKNKKKNKKAKKDKTDKKTGKGKDKPQKEEASEEPQEEEEKPSAPPLPENPSSKARKKQLEKERKKQEREEQKERKRLENEEKKKQTAEVNKKKNAVKKAGFFVLRCVFVFVRREISKVCILNYKCSYHTNNAWILLRNLIIQNYKP